MGNGLADINIFKRRKLAPSLAYGDGLIGDLFSKLGTRILPILKSLVLPASKQFAKNVAGDILRGEKLKGTLKKRGMQSVGEIASKIMTGRGRATGRSKINKKRNRSSNSTRGRVSIKKK